MKDFDVYKANKLYNESNSYQLNKILNNIKKVAEDGQHYLHVYKEISKPVVKKLKERGFRIERNDSHSNPNRVMYYCITGWRY